MGLLDRINFQKQTAEPPESIDVLPDHAIRILWPGGRETTITSWALRDFCPCASCVEEGTGKKLLDSSTIPPDIHPLQINPVGAYAIQIQWSDGHNTGLYAWPTLRQACGLT